MSCGVGHRRGSDPVLLWLWLRPAAAAPIQPLAWELPYTLYAAVAALKRKKKKKQKTKTKNKTKRTAELLEDRIDTSFGYITKS